MSQRFLVDEIFFLELLFLHELVVFDLIFRGLGKVDSERYSTFPGPIVGLENLVVIFPGFRKRPDLVFFIFVTFPLLLVGILLTLLLLVDRIDWGKPAPPVLQLGQLDLFQQPILDVEQVKALVPRIGSDFPAHFIQTERLGFCLKFLSQCLGFPVISQDTVVLLRLNRDRLESNQLLFFHVIVDKFLCISDVHPI